MFGQLTTLRSHPRRELEDAVEVLGRTELGVMHDQHVTVLTRELQFGAFAHSLCQVVWRVQRKKRVQRLNN